MSGQIDGGENHLYGFGPAIDRVVMFLGVGSQLRRTGTRERSMRQVLLVVRPALPNQRLPCCMSASWKKTTPFILGTDGAALQSICPFPGRGDLKSFGKGIQGLRALNW